MTPVNLSPAKPPRADSASTIADRAASPLFRCLAPLTISILAVILFLLPPAAAALEFSRPEILHGQLWRLLTAHLSHFTLDQLLWDTLAFLILSLAVALRSPARYLATLLTSAIAISLAILLLRPDITTYRGLSGIDSALFTAAAILLLKQSRTEKRPALALISALALLLFLAKTLYELLTAKTLFTQNLGPAATPLALAHLTGAAAGLLIALIPARKTAPPASSENPNSPTPRIP